MTMQPRGQSHGIELPHQPQLSSFGLVPGFVPPPSRLPQVFPVSTREPQSEARRVELYARTFMRTRQRMRLESALIVSSLETKSAKNEH